MSQKLRITIGDRKYVVTRPEMADIENAMQIAGNRPGVNQYLFGLLFAKELLKLCITQIDGKDITKAQLETIGAKGNDLLDVGEITALGQQLQKMMNMEDVNQDVKIEILSSGDK